MVSTPLEAEIAAEIRAKGAISFARFMEMALYQPGLGYYERDLYQIGHQGDFYTSVSVGPLFGELLAFAFAKWLKALPGPRQIVETGAHDGSLAQDVLIGLGKHAPEIAREIEYWIVEPSAARQVAQRAKLERYAQLRWATELPEAGRVIGVLFCNELLDAMPVHVFAWNAERNSWEERGVGLEGGSFTWQNLAAPTTPPPALPQALLDVLPNGYTVETSPRALAWWTRAAEALKQGKLVGIDYGGILEELLNPGRSGGTIRAYARHQISGHVLANPGTQDITAHVNFSDVRRAGETAGLKTEGLTQQSQFLTQIARELWTTTGSWPQEQVRQFQTLTHPEHLGRPFRVLVQSRDQIVGGREIR
jgi:SAM-dependent MidA family methyltransferase